MYREIHLDIPRSSPTAYNVFTAYSITSAHMSNGRCVTVSGSAVPVVPAYSETLFSASGHVSLDPAGQQAFINYVGFSTCSGGGENAVASALIPVANVTQFVTTTFSGVSLAAITSMSLAPVSLLYCKMSRPKSLNRNSRLHTPRSQPPVRQAWLPSPKSCLPPPSPQR